METTAEVPVKSAWLSKINWGEALKLAAMLGTTTGLFSIDVELQNHILMTIIGVGAIYTWVVKTFLKPSVTPTSAAKL